MTNTKLTPAHAKRVLQDWIEDEDHVRSLQHWPDLAEAYDALKAFAESSVEPDDEYLLSLLRSARPYVPAHKNDLVALIDEALSENRTAEPK